MCSLGTLYHVYYSKVQATFAWFSAVVGYSWLLAGERRAAPDNGAQMAARDFMEGKCGGMEDVLCMK